MAPQLSSAPCRQGSAVAKRARHRSLERALALVGTAALAGAAACAAGAVNKTNPGVLANDRFTPQLPPAASNGADPALPPCPEPTIVRRVKGYVEDTAKKEGKAAPVLDPRVCALANTLSGWDVAAHGDPPDTMLTFLMHYFGLPEPVPHPVLTTVASDNAKDVARRITDAVTNGTMTMVHPLYGLVTTRPKKGETGVSLVMIDAPVALDPVPRRLDLGGRATVTGKVLGGDFQSSAVIVDDVSGAIRLVRAPLAEPFRAEVVCGNEPGDVLVQIRGEQEGAGTVLANFPVTCGDQLATTVQLPPPAPATVDVGAAEKALFDDANEMRRKAGLPPLQWDEGVAKAARAISDGLRDQAEGKPGGTPDVVALLKQNQVVSGIVLENPAQTRSVYDAEQGFRSSPVHRSNILNKDVNHAGVGVAVVPATQNQKQSMIVNEVFVKETPPLDIGAVREKLRAAVEQKRADARAGQLKDDPNLDQIAQQYAEALAANAGQVPQDQLDAITGSLTKAYQGALNLIAGAEADPMVFAEQPKIIAEGKALGVGVAQGFHPVLGKNAPYVVILIATPKPAPRGRRK